MKLMKKPHEYIMLVRLPKHNVWVGMWVGIVAGWRSRLARLTIVRIGGTDFGNCLGSMADPRRKKCEDKLNKKGDASP